MKKGDIIQRRIPMPVGKSLAQGFRDEEHAREFKWQEYYQFPSTPRLGFKDGMVVILEETFCTEDARVNWEVNGEVGIELLHSGGLRVINLQEEPEWIVIKESTPVYQDSVEHMTDEELRASIEELRTKRLYRPSKPVGVRKKGSTSQSSPGSSEDEGLASILRGKSSEEILELKRKLGLVD